MTKQELRARVRALKKKHTAAQMAQESALICRNLASDPFFAESGCVLMYHALPGEVDLGPLIEFAHSQKKTVLLPVVQGCDLSLRVYRPGCLRVGAFGIMEPIGEEFSCYESITLALVPGMAFSRQGLRLGRGKGYYDRLLPRLANARKVGVCFGFQIMGQIPAEPHDIRMDAVAWH